MHANNWSRIRGSTCILAMIASGFFTNCSCGHADNKKVPITVDPSLGDAEPVPICGDSVYFYKYVGDPSMAQSSVTALPGAPTGWCVPIINSTLRKCPDDGASSIPSTQAFNIFWTLTNVSDAVLTNADVVTYEFHVNKVNAAGAEETVKAWLLTQPLITSTEFQDVGFGFNNGNSDRLLTAGTYRFRLTGIYDSMSTPAGWLATDGLEVVIY